MDSLLYYQPSGKLPAKALPGILLAMLAAVPMGWLYAWLTWHVPLVHLNVLITLCFAGGMAVLMMLALDRGLCRNPPLAALLGLAAGLLGSYVQWAAWLGWALADHQPAAGWLYFLGHPQESWRAVWQVNLAGTWSLRPGGMPLTGGWLTLVWGIEALILLGVPALGAYSQSTTPFSERLGLWFEKAELGPKYVWVGDIEAFVSQLESTPDLLREMLQHAAGDACRYARASVYQCPGEAYAYFNLENVELTRRCNREKLWRRTVIASFRIHAAAVARLG
ncbi:MAG: hypothetical protein H6R19_2665 [Proteobacteria bacterium]|nr:hypothetical protein [Pseudomonadota bacterium]